MTFAWMTWESAGIPSPRISRLAQGVPLVLFQLFGGVLADRINRLRMLIVTQILTSGTLTIAFVLTMSGLVRLEHLLVLAALSNTFGPSTSRAAWPSCPARERDRLPNAIALGSIPWQAGRMIAHRSRASSSGLRGAPGSGWPASPPTPRWPCTAPAAPQHRSGGSGQRVLAQFVEGLNFVGHNFVFA